MMPPNRTVLIILLKLCVCTHFSYLLFLQRIFSSTMLNRNGIPLSSWSGVTFSSFIIIYDAIYLVFVFSKNPETGCGSPLLFSVCWGFFFFFSHGRTVNSVNRLFWTHWAGHGGHSSTLWICFPHLGIFLDKSHLAWHSVLWICQWTSFGYYWKCLHLYSQGIMIYRIFFVMSLTLLSKYMFLFCILKEFKNYQC